MRYSTRLLAQVVLHTMFGWNYNAYSIEFWSRDFAVLLYTAVCCELPLEFLAIL